MKKIFSLLSFLLVFYSSIAQPPIVKRANSTVTVEDARLRALLNFNIPVVSDTTLNGASDSLGLMIYVREGENKGVWYRDSLEISVDGDDTIALAGHIWRKLTGRGEDTVYVADDLYVVWDALGHQVIHRLRNDGLVSGGIVTWTGVGLTFSVSPAIYILNQIEYRTLADTITLDPSDPTNGRFDAFIVDTMPGIGKLTGTPSSDPAFPQEEPISQIVLSYILINAGDVIPTSITAKAIYNENIEWAHVNSGTITADFDNLDYPAAGVKSAYVSSYENNAKINFIYSDSAEDGTISVDSSAVLSMYIYSNGEFPLSNRLHWRWFLDDIPVSNHVTLGGPTDRHGFSSRDSNTYQIVGIPLTAWTWTQSTFNRLVLTMTGTDNSGAKGYYLDVLQLQKGVVIVPPPNDNSNKVDSVTVIAGSDYYWIKGIRYLIGSRTGTTYTADNGLTMASNNVKLGGTLLANTTIDATANYRLDISGSSSQNGGGILRVTNSNAGFSNAIKGLSEGTTGMGVFGESTNYIGVYGLGGIGVKAEGTGTGISAISTTGLAGAFQVNPATTNTVVPIMTLRRTTSSTAANSIGGSLQYYLSSSTGAERLTNEFKSSFTDVTDASRTSQLVITGVNSAVTADLFTLSGSGATRLNKYGVGSFVTGTPAYNLVVDASGNIIESATPFGGNVYTADNGLTMASNNVKLGGTALSANTSIPTSAFSLDATSTNASYTFKGINTAAGMGVFGLSTSGYGVYGQGGDYGIQGYSPTSIGLSGFSDTGLPLEAVYNGSITNSVRKVVGTYVQTSGTAANGLGSSYDFNIETSTGGAGKLANQLISKWTTATDASRVSQFSITGVNNAVTADLFKLDGNGDATVVNLAGTGSRTVLADANGLLSAPVSDIRLKKNIIPVSKYVDVLGLLKDEKKRGVFYNWKDPKRGAAQEIGFLAQGFEDIKGITGTMNNTGYKYLNYDRVTAILWEQNRALLERIEALEKIVNQKK